MMSTELYHRRYFSRSKSDHKYTRREWKNGHWVYYYEDGSNTTGYEKGQNYKTVEQVRSEKKAHTDSIREKKHNVEVKEKRNAEIDKKIDSWIKSGKDKIEEIDFYMSIPVYDLIKMRKKKND